MKKQPLSDWWWLRSSNLPGRYVCPLLVTLSLYLWRVRGKSAHWYPGSDRSPGAYMDGGVSRWEMPICFPKWAIYTECRFWNSRVGIRLRSRRAVEVTP